MNRQLERQESEFDPKLAIFGLIPVFEYIGRRILKIRETGNLRIEEKRDFQDIRTLGDTTSERIIVAHIKKRYPSHRIRGEEETNVESDSPYEWIIDPIDGTTNFASGHDFFGISAGLYRNGDGVVGIIHFPAFHKTICAIKNKGAFLNNKRIEIKKAAETMKEALVVADLTPETVYLFGRLRENTKNVLTSGSFVTGTLWLLEGKIDVFLHSGATPYDLAAAVIIVEEAGGLASCLAPPLNLSDEKIPIILCKSHQLAKELKEIILKS